VAATYRQTASALQIAVPQGGRGGLSEECDGTGRYIAQYLPGDGSQVYLKSKLQYKPVVGAHAVPTLVPFALKPEILKSEGKVQFAPEGGIALVALHDEIVIRGAQVPVNSINDLWLERTQVLDEKRATSELASFGKGIVMSPASEPEAERVGVEALDRARTQGASFRDILGKIKVGKEEGSAGSVAGRQQKGRRASGLGQQDKNELEAEQRKQFGALVASLREQEGAAQEAAGIIKSGSPLARLLIDALGAASNGATEEALVELFNSSAPDLSREALFGLSHQRRPGDRSVKVMLGVLVGNPFDSAALYALGSFSSRFRADGKTGKADEIGEYLVKRLSEASTATNRVTALRALKNSAYAEAVPEIVKCLKDRDEIVREAAVSALGPMKDPAVDDILAAQISSDLATESRVAIIAAARGRAPSKKLAAAIGSIYWQSDTKVRYWATELFVWWLPHVPELRKFLERVGDKEPEEKTRQLARQAL
jgi:hypothetical protein